MCTKTNILKSDFCPGRSYSIFEIWMEVNQNVMGIDTYLIFFFTLNLIMIGNSFYTPFRVGIAKRLFLKSTFLSLSTRVNVATYNILSSELAEPDYFCNCAPEALDPTYRLLGIQRNLQPEIDSKSVICLQEVSHTWANMLHPFFAKQGYHLISGLYGRKFDGYMGVVMAVPMDKYNINNVKIVRVADTKSIVKSKPQNENLLTIAIKKMKKIFRAAKEIWTEKSIKDEYELWDAVKSRQNQMICAELQCKETSTSFAIGTYHMPCAFRNPDLMVAHTALSAQQLQSFAQSKPHLFLGDFNFKPYSSMYDLMTTGSIDKDHPEYPKPTENDPWTPSLASPLASAYMTYQSREPDFTNYAQTGNDPVFIDTLDYIFHSSEWKVESVKETPYREVVGGPLPNYQEPSDHILIGATLSLPSTSTSE